MYVLALYVDLFLEGKRVIQTMADLTPIMIGLVGIGQVVVVAWGIHVMREASRERGKQTDVMLEALLETARGIRELLNRSEGSVKG